MSKPIKRHPAIQQLSRDHHYALLFCWKIGQGLQLQIDTIRIRKYVAYFHQHYLIPHFQEEEQILFVLMPDDEKVKRAIAQHREIEQLVTQQLIAPEKIDAGMPEDASLLTTLAEKLNQHVRYEERELFPYLEQHLSEAQLEQVGKQLAEATHTPDDAYADAFWLKKST
ncbi:hemerythrin HHE cation binding domain-containing protein [Thermoflavifilum aggregans]|uniref:Hemerythrin HHE cation binding domain-containing protein n=1 Tax=Thermoflavifilum aggregans TaxID=454188 RepID=A0A2M9CS35_9BACT|nr:hemerythrin domain-containing protein [Thermoflavifilum aggregans]PJJ74707.1 hemerythrin HHE cation binding domain-containing protein [Thermoflavifilum aggregans]